MSIIYNAKIITANTHFMIFHRCKQCNGKIVITQQNRKRPFSYLNQYYCSECHLYLKSNTTPVYTLQLRIYNPTARTNDNYMMYNESMEKILGCTAEQYVSFIQKQENNQSYLEDRIFGDKIIERLKEYTWDVVLRNTSKKSLLSINHIIDDLIPVLPSTEPFHPILPTLFPSILDHHTTNDNNVHDNTLDFDTLKLDSYLSKYF